MLLPTQDGSEATQRKRARDPKHRACALGGVSLFLTAYPALTSLHHRTTEWCGWKGLERSLVPTPPCHGQGHLSLDCIAQVFWCLNSIRNDAFTAKSLKIAALSKMP